MKHQPPSAVQKHNALLLAVGDWRCDDAAGVAGVAGVAAFAAAGAGAAAALATAGAAAALAAAGALSDSTVINKEGGGGVTS